jgi:hypothetical protein
MSSYDYLHAEQLFKAFFVTISFIPLIVGLSIVCNCTKRTLEDVRLYSHAVRHAVYDALPTGALPGRKLASRLKDKACWEWWQAHLATRMCTSWVMCVTVLGMAAAVLYLLLLVSILFFGVTSFLSGCLYMCCSISIVVVAALSLTIQ